MATLPGFARHLVGRDNEGRACVLLGSVDSGMRAPVRLGGLDVQYALPCTVRMGNDGAEPRVFTVITNTGETAEAERYFLHILATILEIVGQNPTLLNVGEAVTQLAGIFQRLMTPARESVAGIIGELLVIAEAVDPEIAIASWRADPAERYDFVTGNLRLEVKSSLGRRRSHGFSFEQVAVPVGCRGVVASTFVESSAGGLTLEALVGRIARRLSASPSSIFTLEQTLAATLGVYLPEALAFRFDDELGRASLEFFDLCAIPAIRAPINGLVSQIHFVSDLSQIPALNPNELAQDCPDFSGFCPGRGHSAMAKT